VITQIDFDHENFLGHSIEEIAGEKAGIIKPGAWVVSAAENATAQRVIRERAVEQGARLVEIENAYCVSGLRAEDGRYRFAVGQTSEVDGEPAHKIELTLPLAGRFQVRNALTAMAAARLLAERGVRIDDDAIARGLASVHWPGRLERLQERPAVYLDGTHNPAGARELVAFWEDNFAGRRIHLVYGTMRDKAVDEVAGLLFPFANTVTLTQSPQPRSISANVLATMTRHLARTVEVVPDPAAALEHAIEVAAPDDIVFATGSLYLVGDLRRYWDARSAGSARAVSLRPGR
jgi:dihydrofolate synthase/folylpolyglutamate synthase